MPVTGSPTGRLERVNVAAEVDTFDVVADHAGAEIQCLLLHQLHQFDPLDRVMRLAVLFVARLGAGGKL